MTSFLRYAGEWVLWTFWGLLIAFFHGVWLTFVTVLGLGMSAAAFEALGCPFPPIVAQVVLVGVLLADVAVAFRVLWDDKPRPSTWIVGRGRATLVRRDDFGKLWTLRPGLDGESVRVVEVVNATAESDGSYRHYFLQVPPWVGTAREAVAWTFGFANADEYALTVES